ncbi:hypothetical protein BDY21DRAFT_365889 [Lineolata rhizophorae]|uniref:Secreted protein n=1 Tax=Lineolata rhizophorae TaxID=578093 RepID=A0A6A6NT16_9PEZI|nr:hypothetical protein BDY21DRAFT_365889 [Lineolata rhizophorae]
MYTKYFTSAFFLTLLGQSQVASALWGCPDSGSRAGKFLIHYTPARNSNYMNPDSGCHGGGGDYDSWVRICLPKNDGSYSQIHARGTCCGSGHPKTLHPDQTGLPKDIKIHNGHGCSTEGANANLDNLWITYRGTLHNVPDDPNCSDPDHGSTCEFSI